MERIKKEDLQREVTHQGYKYKNRLNDKGQKSWLPKVIDEEFLPFNGPNPDYLFVSDEFLKVVTGEKVAIYWGGGATLILTILFTLVLIKVGHLPWFPALLYIFSICYTIFSIVAYFTIPPKEIILNRKDGTITFPGWYWLDNVTMRFDDIKFGYTTGGPNGTGGYMLQILRPDRVGSFELFNLGSLICYESLSAITWYMDKNRPLPPGDLFDPYRERDFQRRKKEKFPRPLYPASIPTPEATAAQQKEREKYWRG